MIEAPVNGGRNYKKADCSYVNKFGYMLEIPYIFLILISDRNSHKSKKLVNQQEIFFYYEKFLRDFMPSNLLIKIGVIDDRVRSLQQWRGTNKKCLVHISI